MSAGNEFIEGLISAVTGFVIAILLPVFFQVFGSINAPWWIYILLGCYVLVTIGYDLVAGVSNSIFYTIGFALGALILQDYLALIAVIIVLVVIFLLRRDASE